MEVVKAIKLKLIEYIINTATEEQIEGLEELLLNNDINYGLEKILGGKSFDLYLKTVANDFYYEDLSHILANLESGDVEGTIKMLQETLDK